MKFGAGIGVVIGASASPVGATMEGPTWSSSRPGDPDRARRDVGATIAACGLPRPHLSHPQAFIKALMPRGTSTWSGASTRSSATPRRRAGTACWRSTSGGPRRSSDPFIAQGHPARGRRHGPGLSWPRCSSAENEANAQAPLALARCGRSMQAGRLRPHDGHRRHRVRPRQRALNNLDITRPRRSAGSRRRSSPTLIGCRLRRTSSPPDRRTVSRSSPRQEMHFREMTRRGTASGACGRHRFGRG